MKLTRLFLFLAIAFVAGSCSSDDDGAEVYSFNKDNLTGTYSLVFYESKKVKTKNDEGFTVTTTTIGKGDTFSVTWSFNSDNKVTYNGTYRVTRVITQGGQTREEAEIIVLDNERSNYSVHQSNNELTIDGKIFKVSGFSRTAMTLKHSNSTVEEDGATVVYDQELRFTR